MKINTSIKNSVIRELCGFTKQQARTTIDKMLEENLILKVGAGSATEYKLKWIEWFICLHSIERLKEDVGSDRLSDMIAAILLLLDIEAYTKEYI